jgi:hypothetical protein
MYALVSHSDSSSGGPDGMLQPARGPKAEDKDKEVAFVFTDIESSTELSNQDGDAFKQVRHCTHHWCCLGWGVFIDATVNCCHCLGRCCLAPGFAPAQFCGTLQRQAASPYHCLL